MPTVLKDAPLPPAVPNPRRKRWTRGQYAALRATGIFDGERLELIEGELVNKMGQGLPHANALRSMFRWLQRIFGEEFVSQDESIDVGPDDNPINEPQPDILVFSQEYFKFKSGNPQPEQLRLVVEVADTTLDFDLITKAG